MPCPPRQHGQAELRGKLHVSGSAAGKANHARARRGDKGGVQLTARTKSSHEEKHGQNQQGGELRRRDTRRPVFHSEDFVRHHFLPVKQYWLLQPWRAVECGNNPVMSGQHLSANLRVSRLIGANQHKTSHSEKENKTTDTQDERELDEQQFGS